MDEQYTYGIYTLIWFASKKKHQGCLAGTLNLIAVRFQIAVMAMILGSAGMSIILYSLISRQTQAFLK